MTWVKTLNLTPSNHRAVVGFWVGPGGQPLSGVCSYSAEYGWTANTRCRTAPDYWCELPFVPGEAA